MRRHFLSLSLSSIRGVGVGPLPFKNGGLVAVPFRGLGNNPNLSPLGKGKEGEVEGEDDEGFEPLDIVKSKSRQRRGPLRARREFAKVAPPRYLKMPVDQDWGSVWPVARTFHPASVPLPLHQGFVPSHKPVPNKWGNLELMKIPNFLHLTPPVIKRQCEALKKFCTPFPQELKRRGVLEALFPVEITSSDYCHSLPTIRDFRSRIVTIQVPLSSLNFDYHAKDKFLRLIGDKYSPTTDLITLTMEYCPLRKQNYEHGMYLLTALYHEALNTEKWEDEKTEEDMEKYVWEGSISKKTLTSILGGKESLEGKKDFVEKYEKDVTHLHNEGEDLAAVEEYGKSVRSLLGLPLPPS